jgi:hypothetical protein
LDPKKFSPEGLALFVSSWNEHGRNLLEEAERAARRGRTDTVSAIHVLEATQHLVRRPVTRWYSALRATGAFCMAAAVTQLISMVSGDIYTNTRALVVLLLGVFAAICLVICWQKKH